MRAKGSHGFLPSGLDGIVLEDRLVLSQSALMTPALVLNPAQHSMRALRHQSAQNQVNQAFDQFTTDYLQAQQVYLASSGLSTSNFTDYTTQRVSLLNQQLVHALISLPGSLKKLRPPQRLTPSQSTVLQNFLFRTINGTGTNAPSSLLTVLGKAVPPASTAGTPISPPAVTLFSLEATNAIQSARLNTVNAAHLLSTSTFQPYKNK
jgi:hypothetical protein